MVIIARKACPGVAQLLFHGLGAVSAGCPLFLKHNSNLVLEDLVKSGAS